jgi:hypothetical protein
MLLLLAMQVSGKHQQAKIIFINNKFHFKIEIVEITHRNTHTQIKKYPTPVGLYGIT